MSTYWSFTYEEQGSSAFDGFGSGGHVSDGEMGQQCM